ncbi:MAG TPA: hypothetical protein VF006_18765 [Longimicrobium sp.]
MPRRSRPADPARQPQPAAAPLRMLAWDKLGFGLAGALIVVLATGAINFQLERVRSRNAVWKDVATARFTRIAEVWERLNEYEAAVRRASGEARRQAAEPQWMARHLAPEMRRESLDRAAELLRAGEQAEERFWTAYHSNRSYADERVLSQILEHYRYVRWIYLAEESELRHARLRLSVEEPAALQLPSAGVDYTTPAIAAAQARLDTTRRTAIDIQREVLRIGPD